MSNFVNYVDLVNEAAAGWGREMSEEERDKALKEFIGDRVSLSAFA